MTRLLLQDPEVSLSAFDASDGSLHCAESMAGGATNRTGMQTLGSRTTR